MRSHLTQLPRHLKSLSLALTTIRCTWLSRLPPSLTHLYLDYYPEITEDLFDHLPQYNDDDEVAPDKEDTKTKKIKRARTSDLLFLSLIGCQQVNKSRARGKVPPCLTVCWGNPSVIESWPQTLQWGMWPQGNKHMREDRVYSCWG